MARTIVLGVFAGVLVAANWLRLEEGESGRQAALVVALALLPALIPAGGRRRAAAGTVAFLVAAGIAFDLGPGPDFPGHLLARLGGGFLDYYDVQLPFDHVAHPRMEGVLLLAVFTFTLLVALATAARRPGLAALALLIGVGWPATLLPGHDLLRGALLLVGVLVLLVGLRQDPLRGLGYTAAAGGVVVLAAVAGSSSPALAKREFLHWQAWDPYTRPAKPVDVGYVWNSSYTGLSFRGKKTTVLRIESATPHYWRATVLTWVEGGHWREEPAGLEGDRGLAPPRQTDPHRWDHQQVTVEALHDHHLVGASVPVQFEAGSSLQFTYDPVGVAYVRHAPRRGQSYRVSSYSPRPSPAQLIRSKPVYPALIAKRRAYLEVDQDISVPPFGTPGRARKVEELFSGETGPPTLGAYRPLYANAQEVAGGAKSPYAAAVALERWFRAGGGFVYDQHPPRPPAGVPALVDFVTRTRSGYCQHFAGAMALMLRYLGVPARVAVGFTSGRYDRGKGEWVVADRDAHAWVEVWFRGWGWLPFDPTPSRGGLPGGYSASSSQFDAAAAAAVLAAKTGFGSAFERHRGELGFATGSLFLGRDVPRIGEGRPPGTKGRSHTPDLLLLALVLAGLVALVVLTKLVLRRGRYLTRNPRRLATACRKELRDLLLDQHMEVLPSATLRELGELVESEFRVEAAAFALHATTARFGPATGAREAARAMRRELRALRRELRAELTWLERGRGLLSLRSLGLA